MAPAPRAPSGLMGQQQLHRNRVSAPRETSSLLLRDVTPVQGSKKQVKSTSGQEAHEKELNTLSLWECQSKSLHTHQDSNGQKTANSKSVSKNAQKLGTSRVAVGNVKWHSCRGKQFLRKVNIERPYDPAARLLGKHPGRVEIGTRQITARSRSRQRDSGSDAETSPGPVSSGRRDKPRARQQQTQRQAQGPSAGEQRGPRGWIHKTQRGRGLKGRKDAQIPATTWMDLENTTLRERGRTQKVP